MLFIAAYRITQKNRVVEEEGELLDCVHHSSNYGLFVGMHDGHVNGGGVKHSNNHSPNIIKYHLQYMSHLYDGRNATVIL